ncbi:MAG: hypothetical protein ACI865_001499 [Flavobacteriaceae bacterium]|jgi:hypothetical protein
MIKHLLILLCGVFTLTSFGQGWVPMGARSMSMANASTTLNDVWGFHHNPAALADIETVTAGVSYENRFLLRELQSQGFAVAIPLSVGVLSVGGQTYGYSQYRSYKGGLGYSMQLAEKLYAGVQLNYLGLQLPDNYGSKSSLSAEAGIYAKFTDNWKIGFSVYNMGRAKLADFEDDRFSTVMRIGTAYTFSEKVIVAVDLEKNLDYPLRFKMGVEYEVVDNFFLRGGMATNPVELTFGFGYKLRQIQLGIGSAYHQTLGWSPHFALIFQSAKNG